MPDAARMHVVGCAPPSLAAAAYAHIVRAHDPRADLTQITVLLPGTHVCASFARGLAQAYGSPVLLLPRICTLREWARSVATETPVLAPAAREALLYRVLAERRWMARPDLWTIAAQLAQLFDELTRWRIGMPQSADEFVQAIDRAYRARAGVSFMFEARLVHELWHALAQDAGRLDPEAAYHLNLGKLVSSVHAPVYAVGLGPLAPAEQEFLERCAEHVPVTWVQVRSEAAPGADALVATLANAWPQAIEASMHARARDLRAASAVSPLAGRLRLFGAANAEQEARAVDVSVRRWLAQGRREIAVIVLDRVSARRARALLERAQILVRDEAGWAFSTTSAATVIGRWFDAIGNDFHHRDLLDVLKSPFAFHDWPRHTRQQAVWRLERAVRGANLRSGLARFRTLASQAGDHELGQMLARVDRGVQALGQRRRKTLAAWIAALGESLTEIGVRAGLAADLAGAQLLELLNGLAADLAGDALRVDVGDFRRWLARILEGATFRDVGIESPVVFTSLDAMRMRRFDAVLLLGADAAHLPGGEAATVFFNQAVRRELGLPGRAQELRALEEQLFELFCTHDDVLVTWQRNRDGEENLLSPLIERLRALHRLAWDDTLEDARLGRILVGSALVAPDPAPMPEPTVVPAPRAPAALFPHVISPSGYNTLLACPYRYYARYVLGLRALDEIQEEVDKSDYGIRIHAVLAGYHGRYRSLLDTSAEEAVRALEEMSVAQFEPLVQADYLASAWLVRWLALIPQYVAWQRSRESEGWRFAHAEAERTLTISTPAGRSLSLRGRIDRIDLDARGAAAVIDYKSQASAGLRAKLVSPGEDVQLPAYALLWGGETAAALFLSLDRDVAAVVLEGDIGAHAAAVQARLAHLYDAMAEGAALPAQGAETVCARCEMHGLCRRKHWP